jgi:hypothetical protein
MCKSETCSSHQYESNKTEEILKKLALFFSTPEYDTPRTEEGEVTTKIDEHCFSKVIVFVY